MSQILRTGLAADLPEPRAGGRNPRLFFATDTAVLYVEAGGEWVEADIAGEPAEPEAATFESFAWSGNPGAFVLTGTNLDDLATLRVYYEGDSLFIDFDDIDTASINDGTEYAGLSAALLGKTVSSVAGYSDFPPTDLVVSSAVIPDLPTHVGGAQINVGYNSGTDELVLTRTAGVQALDEAAYLNYNGQVSGQLFTGTHFTSDVGTIVIPNASATIGAGVELNVIEVVNASDQIIAYWQGSQVLS